MKYIIDVPEDRVHGDILCALAIMEDSLDHYLPTGIKAVPYDESEAEQRGIDKAWKLAQELENMEIDDWKDCFHGSCEDGLTKMSFDEANERYKEWSKRKDDKQNREKVIALANDIGINCLYTLVCDIRDEQ